MSTNPSITMPTSSAPALREGLCVLLCALAILFAVGELDSGIDLAMLTQGDSAQRLALNALPALALFGLLLGATRRAFLSGWLVLLLVAGLYAANTAKIGALQTPLLPADLRFLAQPGPALQLFSKYLHIGVGGLALAAAGVALTLALARGKRLESLRGWRAPVLGIAALVACLGLIAGSKPLRGLYQNAERAFQPWALGDSVARTGLIGSLLVYHWQISGNGVPTADREAAVTLLRANAPVVQEALAATTPAGMLPDIVVVQSESAFDPARVRGMLSGRFLRQFERLSKRGTSGDLVVPTYAGGTIRTEFEMLTGAPLASLGGVQYPWVELEPETYPGITRVLNDQGYRTVAIHPNAAAFWNRDRAYPAIGFDQFIDGESFSRSDIVGLFTSDKAMTDRILVELASDGPPQFLFAISMENHGPYDWRPNLDAKRLAELPMPEGLDEGGRLWFRHYLYMLDDADHELGRLADALMKRKRRTLLLFYGDHLPDLAPVYHQLGFDDGGDAKSQPVPWLMLDNRKKATRHLDTRGWALPAHLLHAAGISDGAYFSVVNALLDNGFDPDSDEGKAGLTALARLHLRGELDEVIGDALGDNAAALTTPMPDTPAGS